MKSFREWLKEEGVAVNNAGGGNVAGIGVGTQGEPGIEPADTKKRKRKKQILFYSRR